jgi:RNA polymerase sigma factor (sigma-70 family)
MIAAAQIGDEIAIGSLLERHLPMLRGFVRLQIGAFLRARESESDVVQSVCLEVLRRGERLEFRGEAAFRSWLYHAVLLKVRDHERHWRAQKRTPGGGGEVRDDQVLAAVYHSLSPSRQAIAREDLQRVEAAFARLPEHYARALVLQHIVGLEISAIAAELERTVAATEVLLRRAQVRLAREVDG